MKVAAFVYKCRLCNEIIEGQKGDEAHASIYLGQVAWNGKVSTPPLMGVPITMSDVHKCRDGNWGITDLIGLTVKDE